MMPAERSRGRIPSLNISIDGRNQNRITGLIIHNRGISQEGATRSSNSTKRVTPPSPRALNSTSVRVEVAQDIGRTENARTHEILPIQFRIDPALVDIGAPQGRRP
ncbi:MAG: hypothetical protein DRJ61_14415 [Acidobacteria bacterium]|nr:MAG: hypothetical protein DRJ65_05960 [Acidobacteriota bacterium]RLE29505.1 MAG: hypothetical protein DRJ61_14415 [Acidobacteriota bacterium]